MALSLNKVILAGPLADKPLIRETETGRKMVGLSIMTTRQWCDGKSGKTEESQEWHRIVILQASLAAFAEAELVRGDEVYLEGELHTEFWRDDTYQWRTLTRIILWQDAHQLRRLIDQDQNQTGPSARQAPPLLEAAREAHLFETPSDDALLGYVA